MSPNEKSLELLRKAAAQFRYYEEQHNEKAQWDGLFRYERDARLQKARVNGDLAAELEAHIRFLEDDAA